MTQTERKRRNRKLRLYVLELNGIQGFSHKQMAETVEMSKQSFSNWFNGRDAGEKVLARLELLYIRYK